MVHRLGSTLCTNEEVINRYSVDVGIRCFLQLNDRLQSARITGHIKRSRGRDLGTVNEKPHVRLAACEIDNEFLVRRPERLAGCNVVIVTGSVIGFDINGCRAVRAHHLEPSIRSNAVGRVVAG